MGKKIVIDGKEYDLDDFDDTRRWTKVKKDKGFYGHMKMSRKHSLEYKGNCNYGKIKSAGKGKS